MVLPLKYPIPVPPLFLLTELRPMVAALPGLVTLLPLFSPSLVCPHAAWTASFLKHRSDRTILGSITYCKVKASFLGLDLKASYHLTPRLLLLLSPLSPALSHPSLLALCFPACIVPSCLNVTPLPVRSGGTSGKESKPAHAEDARGTGSIPGLGRSPRGGNGTPLQYSCLENPMGRGPWRAAVHGVMKSWTWLSDWVHNF